MLFNSNLVHDAEQGKATVAQAESKNLYQINRVDLRFVYTNWPNHNFGVSPDYIQAGGTDHYLTR